MRRIAVMLSFSVLVTTGLFAQTAPPGAKPTPTTPPAQAPKLPPRSGAPGVTTPVPSAPVAPEAMPGVQTPRPAPPPTIQQVAGLEPRSWQNLKIEVAISDSLSADVQYRKSVTMIVADNRSGQVRSNSGEGVINVDARPQIQRDGRIMLQLTVEYRPNLTLQQTQQTGASTRTTFTESMTLIVPDAKLITVSQSSDPGTDRRMTLDVTTTILK